MNLDEFKPNLQEVFLTFGLGALLCSISASIFHSQSLFRYFRSGFEGINITSELWLPISIALVFLLHALGTLAIAVGSIAAKLYPIGRIDQNEIYIQLVEVDNPWLWKKFLQVESDNRLTEGIAGICIIFIVLFLFSLLDKILNSPHELLFSWLFFVMFCSCAFMCIARSVNAFLEIKLLLLLHKGRQNLGLPRDTANSPSPQTLPTQVR